MPKPRWEEQRSQVGEAGRSEMRKGERNEREKGERNLRKKESKRNKEIIESEGWVTVMLAHCFVTYRTSLNVQCLMKSEHKETLGDHGIELNSILTSAIVSP